MGFILFLVFGFLFLFFPVVRCAVCHPVSLTIYGVKDLFQYFRNREYNFCGSGELVGYTGLFGKGKTLSAVHRVVGTYKAFDGKKVWCPRRRKIVTQKIKVISNVALKIPYEELKSLKQIVQAAKSQQDKELKEACKGFEAMFLNMMYKEMRATVPENSLFGESNAQKIFRDMHDEKLMENVADGGGVGLADLLYRQLSPQVNGRIDKGV